MKHKFKGEEKKENGAHSGIFRSYGTHMEF
jgi:hypothetical protein